MTDQLVFDIDGGPVCAECGDDFRTGWHQGVYRCENCIALALGGYVYFATHGKPRTAGMVKIGWSSDPYRRLDQLRREFGQPLDFFGLMPGSREDERTIHQWFSELRIEREWFRFGPVRDWFNGLDLHAPAFVGGIDRP